MSYSQPALTFQGKCEKCGQAKPDCQPVMPEAGNPYVMAVCRTCRHGGPVVDITPDAGLLHGPICDGAAKYGGCYHDSCQSIEADCRIHLAEGPICVNVAMEGDCKHESCKAIEPEQGECARHGWQFVLDAGVSSGFAGGRVYWANLACGCFDVDESDDLRAAI